jgi:endonuclease/exonuclease/phosphatase family metal-dependent hydrolase
MRLLLPIIFALSATACVATTPGDDPASSAAVSSCRGGGLAVAWVSAEPPAVQHGWCAAVGPPLLQRGPAALAAVDSLLVVTWNVQVGGGDLPLFIRRLQRGELTGGGPVRHFVILLQETFRRELLPQPAGDVRSAARIAPDPPGGRRRSVDEVARELDLSVLYVPSMRNGLFPELQGRTARGDAGVAPRNAAGGAARDGAADDAAPVAPAEDRGNAILSTLPLHGPVALELPVVRQRRVAVVALVRGRSSAGADWELQLVSAHLENRGGADLVGVRGRALQAEWLASSLPPAQLSVLGADLNTWVRGENEAAFARLLPHFPSTPAALPPGPTHVSHLLMRTRVDYIMARVPGGRMTGYERAPEPYGSDHYPLLAWVHLPPGP